MQKNPYTGSFGSAVAVVIGYALMAASVYAQAPKQQPKIVLVGDSTVAVGGGWGPGFCATLTAGTPCLDDALNGRSSKSFIAEGAWQKALAEHGNFYLIQFGHNDMKGKGPERETDPDTTFAENLKLYIRDVRAIGATPVLVTSLSRRTFKDGAVVEDLKDYAAATRKVGEEEHVSVIDLNALSTAMLNRMGQKEADGFNAVGQEKERLAVGKSATDRTHLNPHGQQVFGQMVARELAQLQPELRPLIHLSSAQ